MTEDRASVGTVVVLDQTRALADALRQAMSGDTGTVVEAYGTPADAVNRVATAADVDAVVLGPGSQEPVRAAQQVHAADGDVALILVSEAERQPQLARMIQFAPYLGDDVRCLPTNDGAHLAHEVTAAVHRARQRRTYRRTLAAMSARLPPTRLVSLSASQYLGRLLDIAPVGVGLIDERGLIVGWNRQGAVLMQRTEGEVVGTPLEHLFPLAERPRLRAALTHWITYDTPVGPEVLEVVVDGSGLRRFEFTGAAVHDASRRSALVVFQDVTERIQAAERERQALAAAEAALHVRDEFLGIAAHELKTPVTSLKGSAQLLLRMEERGALDRERLRRGLRTINSATDQLMVLVSDLLDIAQTRMGRMEMHLQEADLGSLVRSIGERYADEFEDRGQVLVVRTNATCPVLLDPVRFEQVLVNLLTNAVKYSPAAGQIEVIVRDHDCGALLEVKDQGMGFPTTAAEAIFEAFGRAANASKRQIQGMGLGLYICRQIVEARGGRIWAESPGEGQGATFSVWLPCAEKAGLNAPRMEVA